MRPMPVALQARGVSRSFRGFRALDHVDLSVAEGEIHAILGPNGAGKTTLFNCLSGFLQPTEGTGELCGEPIAALPPHRIVDRGLSRSFQISSVFETLTVLENLVVALQARTGHPVRVWEPREGRRGPAGGVVGAARGAARVRAAGAQDRRAGPAERQGAGARRRPLPRAEAEPRDWDLADPGPARAA